MKLIVKNFCFVLLLIISRNSFGQKNNLDMIAVSKKVRLLDSAQFFYIVHDTSVNFLTFLCKSDMKDFTGFLMITYDAAISKDAKVADLPYVPAGEYLSWDEKKNSWVSKKGNIKDVLTKLTQ